MWKSLFRIGYSSREGEWVGSVLGALAVSLGLLGQGTSTWVAWAIAGCQTGFEGVLRGFSGVITPAVPRGVSKLYQRAGQTSCDMGTLVGVVGGGLGGLGTLGV